MSDFSVTEAAFSGYGLMKRKPGLLLVLGVLGILVGMLIGVLAVQIAGPQMAQLQDIQTSARTGGAPPNPAAMLPLLGAILRFTLLTGLIGLALGVINTGAVNRAVLRGKASRLPFIAFAGDELRLLVVAIAIGVMLAIPALVLLIIGQIVVVGMTIAGRGAGALRAGGAARLPVGALVTEAIVYGVVLIAIVLAGVKFALASAQTVAERGIRIFGSWQLTNGRYWKVLGALLLAGISLIPILLVVGVILFGVAKATGAEVSSLMRPDYSTMATAFSPLTITRYVLTGIAGAVATIVTSSTTANIYRALTGGAESVFSDDDDDDEDWGDEE